ncbi:aminotransferase class III-fold pyridoxal phosphate-dependent enzyme [Nocardioides convexus]|uniref:aminotransferase class III-fold pyridoxal phosphate-dependent enzyme n=1 Tax=Nocardioides convexus TaxID=2712224 RepID=UPI0024189368|nr:aminotransferase class III-fold pyridoxal phosphate-dependent enzyme [Nocardioides convexus]
MIVEPLLGLGGCVVLPKGFLARLRALCDEHGALLILDEVFCGFGRTGRMFGFDHDEIAPDLVTLSKGISGGYLPLAAVGATSTIKRSFLAEPIAQGLRYGHTTGGHAVAAAVANAVLDVMADERLVENSAAQGARLLAGLKSAGGQRRRHRRAWSRAGGRHRGRQPGVRRRHRGPRCGGGGDGPPRARRHPDRAPAHHHHRGGRHDGRGLHLRRRATGCLGAAGRLTESAP